MTLRAQITADVESVYLNTSDFAEEITHYPADNGQPETVTAVIDYDFLEQATRQFGVMIHTPTDDSGTQIKNRAIVELSSEVIVTEERPGGFDPSRFEIFNRDGDGELAGGSSIWIAKRLIGKDHGMQSVEVWLVEEKATKRQ